MKFMRNVILVIVISTFSTGCATGIAKKITIPEPLALERTEPYTTKNTEELEQQLIKTAQDITSNIKYGTNINGKIEITTDPSKANYVLMTPDTFDKIADLVTLSNGCIDIIKEQNALINKYIENINSLKTLAEFERQKNILACTQWQQSEENFDAEHKARVHEKLLHTITTATAIIGGIAYIAIGL